MLDDKNQVHESLFSENTLKLGEIHWTLLKSACVMDGQRWHGSTYKNTAFGKEVGGDEIHWWVFEKETHVDELLAITEQTLGSVQALKQASSKLKKNTPESYLDLLLTLKDFAEQHRADAVDDRSGLRRCAHVAAPHRCTAGVARKSHLARGGPRRRM